MTSSYRLWILGVWVVSALAAVIGIAFSSKSIVLAVSPAFLVMLGCGLFFAYGLATGVRWPMAVLFAFALLLFSTNIRGDTAGTPNSGQGFDAVSAAKLVVFTLGLMCGATMLQSTYRKLIEPPGIMLLAFVVWALFTTPLSLDPVYSAGMVFGMCAWLLFAAALAVRLQPREIMVMLMLGLSLFLFGSLVFYFFVPELGRFLSLGTIRLKGLASTPNEAGQMAGFFLVAGAAYLIHGGGVIQSGLIRAWLVMSSFMALAVLGLAQTRGAIVGVFCALVAMTIQRFKMAWVGLVLLLTLVPLGFAWLAASPDSVALLASEASSISRSGNASETESLAGRTNIWKFAAGKIMDNPILGYGYGASAKVLVSGYSTRWGTTTGSAHNAFLQTSLDLGLVGGGLLVAIFAWNILAALRNPSPFRDGMFVLVLFTCLLESAVSKPANSVVLIWLVSLFVPPETIDAVQRSDESEMPPAA